MSDGGRPRPLRGPGFRAWELVHAAVLLLLLTMQLWAVSAAVAVVLVVHLGTWRVTRCGVETTHGRPCRWLVRGVLGCCDFHPGFKHGAPRATLPTGALLPRPLWRRPASAGPPDDDPQPGGASSRALVPAPNTRDAYGHFARRPRWTSGVVRARSYDHEDHRALISVEDDRDD